MLHLCEALASEPPRLFAAFTSTIGLMGFPGSAAYAFSNTAVDLLLHSFAKAHPETSVMSIAWGLWAGTGLGAKYHTSEMIRRLGLHYGELPIKEGVERFVHLMTHDPGSQLVAVTGRVVGFEPWSQITEPPASSTGLRYIERVSRIEPNVELVARCRLSLERDLYLQHHVYRGMYVMPTVFAADTRQPTMPRPFTMGV